MLAVVMIASMIPAMSLASSAADVVGYRSIVTTDYIVIDGDMDDVYKSSEKITSHYWGKGNSSLLSFEAHTAVTAKGLYVWAEIKDSTLNKTESEGTDVGDKFQIYVRMSNGADTAWGWYDTDYLGRNFKTVRSGALADAEYSSAKLSDGSGWRSETFIPFDGAIDVIDIKSVNISIGLQANDAIGQTNTAYCYDKDARNPYYYEEINGYTLYSPLRLFV